MIECKLDDATPIKGMDNATDEEVGAFLRTKKMFDEAEIAKDTGISDSIMRFFRFDRFAVMNSSKSPLMRQLGKVLTEDPNATGGTVRESTATAIKHIESGKFRTQYYRTYIPSFKEFLKERQLNTKHLYSQATREEFNELIAKSIRNGGQGVSPAANKVAKVQAQVYEDVLTLAQKVGVKGAEDIKANKNYITRTWSKKKVHKLIEKFDRKYPGKGRKKLEEFIARSMKQTKGSEEALEDFAKRTKYLSKMLLRHVMDSEGSFGVNLDRILKSKGEDLASYLRTNTDMSNDDIGMLLSSVFKTDRDKAGRITQFKRRIDLDETYADAELRIDDFLENDSELLFLSYINSLTGQIALANKGFKSRADFDSVVNQLKQETEADMLKGNMSRKDKLFRDSEMRALQSVYDHLTGKPLEDNVGGAWSTFGRVARKYNFARVMNQVGFAQLAEIGNLTSAIGLKQTIRHLPELRKMLKRHKDGEVDDALVNEFEVFFGGFGNERMLNQITNTMDDFGSRAGTGVDSMSQFERGLDHLGRFTADISGMNGVNMIMKRLAMKGMLQKFADEAFDGKSALGSRKVFSKDIGKMSEQRYADLGISNDMRDRIMESIRQFSDTTKGSRGGKLTKLNIEKWDDDVRDAFSLAMSRWGRRTIQENDIGETIFAAGFADTTTGKIVLQFRGFMTTAYGKHLLHGLRSNDLQAYSQFMTSSFMAGMAWYGQTYVQSVGMSKKERQKFFDKKFGKTDEEFYMNWGKAAFQRSAWASILPATIDTGADFFMDDPIFSYRSTGLSSNLVTGNPTAQLLINAYEASRGTVQAMIYDDEDYSQKTYNKTLQLFVLQNMLGIQNATKALGQEFLPEKP